ncbi:PIN domain-containing protein [Brucella rhizosphaerae]|uniref:PIN domain-containing protein n=1 Tax=Brucella rhizosphaerae TaxID=571254 RepID=UPI000463CA80|nr:PIN domain-containing protein [Brucella rhizosphaerae]
MPLNIFLDTNIYLSFYSLSNADVAQLDKLRQFVAQGEVRILACSQLRDEIHRNRENKIRESFKAVRDTALKCQAPAFVKNLETFTELQEILKEANKKHSELVVQVEAAIDANELDADRMIEALLDAAEVKEVSESVFVAAINRLRIGNPPGKKSQTCGDEINWEFILSESPDGEDIHIVSADGDYASPLDQNKINSFMQSEWRQKKKSEIFFYRDLPSFFSKHVPTIQMAMQQRLAELIAELSASGSFATTHSLISQFPENPDFTDAHIIELINILHNNPQVGWISEDPDVKAFYGPIEARYNEASPNATEQ